MQLDPYLMFNGTCKDAFTFYEKLLGGKIQVMMTHAESPMADQVKPEWRDKIIHAAMKVGDRMLMASDAPPEHHEPMQGFSISINVKEPAEAERVFQALAENGQVRMPLQKTFFSASFGMLVDRFGTPWMINCEGAK